MYYEDILGTVVNDETSVEFNLRCKHSISALKQLDNNYETFSIPFYRYKYQYDNKEPELITIENYGSGSQGRLIRNAVTGVKYNITVGSADESTLFKVADATARHGRKYPLMLYYDSPEQYESHQFLTLSQEVKQSWHKRNFTAREKIYKQAINSTIVK